MNFLAHAFLSGGDGDILLGNLMADFLRPGTPIPNRERVKQGVAWHYQIDRFMDSHPLVARSRARLFPQHRHYSAVLVDLFYDHLLATSWNQWSQTPLEQFAPQVYAQLTERLNDLPERMREVVPAMIEGDWLRSYAREDGIRYALTRIQRRASKGEGLGLSWDEFSAHRSLYQAEFDEFMPQILALRDVQFSTEDTKKNGETQNEQREI